MSSDASFDGYGSPSTKSVSQVSVASNYYVESTPPLSHFDAESQRQQQQQPHMTAAAVPRVAVQASTYQPSFTSSYLSQPAMSSYYAPVQSAPTPQSQISGLFYQRPLPQVRRPPFPFPTSHFELAANKPRQNFPPLPISVTLAPSSGANPWQHHHYISPSSAASFPQSQDRYICPTCSKAFSRPSSLRIHSHSHTGEKPFKCPHLGCGKAFSVRSNMKRHERGCHSFESTSGGSAMAS